MKLIGTKGVYAGAELELTEPVVIGRNEQVCNLIIPGNSLISSQHCRIEPGQGFAVLTDLGSTNGTYLDNGTKLVPNQPVRLSSRQGFFLSDGSVSFIVMAAEAPQPMPMPVNRPGTTLSMPDQSGAAQAPPAPQSMPAPQPMPAGAGQAAPGQAVPGNTAGPGPAGTVRPETTIYQPEESPEGKGKKKKKEKKKAAPTNVTGTPEGGKSKKGLIIGIVIGVVLLLAIGGGVAAYFLFFNKAPDAADPGKEKEQTRIEGSFYGEEDEGNGFAEI